MRFSSGILGILKKEIVEAFVIIAELEERKVEFYSPVWDYDYYTLVGGEPDVFLAKMEEICNKWFRELPTIYSQVYDARIEKNKYRFAGRYVYKNKYIDNGICGPWLSSVVQEYESNSFQIEHNPSCCEEIEQYRGDVGLLSISKGLLIEQFLHRKTPFYDAIHCLIYQGICNALNFKCNGLTIGGSSLHLF